MADSPQHNISSGQLLVFILSAQIGLGIFGLARNAVAQFGRAGWLLVLAIGLLAVSGVAMSSALCGRFRASILAINRRVLGRIPGGICNALILSLLLASTLVNLAFHIQIMKLIFFKDTPFAALAAILLAPVVYLTAKGLKVVARFDTFVYIAVLSLLGMSLAGRSQAEWTFLLPLISFKIQALPRGLPWLTFGFLGFDLLLIVYPRVRRGQWAAALAAVGLNVLILSSFTAFIIAYYGEELVPKLAFPLLNLVRTIQAPVLERLEIYFLMIWLPAMGSTVTAFFVATQLAAVELFPRPSYRLILALLTAAVALPTLYLQDLYLVERLAAVVGTVEFFALGLCWPALIWCLAAARGLKA